MKYKSNENNIYKKKCMGKCCPQSFMDLFNQNIEYILRISFFGLKAALSSWGLKPFSFLLIIVLNKESNSLWTF